MHDAHIDNMEAGKGSLLDFQKSVINQMTFGNLKWFESNRQ